MRIATWNMERAGRGRAHEAKYDKVITSFCADLIIITEPGPHFAIRYPQAVMSPAKRLGKDGPESWVAIVGHGLEPVDLDLPYGRLAAAAFSESFGVPIAIYGSILPWNAAVSQAPDVYANVTLSFGDLFDRALHEQKSDIRALQSTFGQGHVFWAGDFNHPLVGSLHGFASHARTGIVTALEDLEMRAFNYDAPHAKPTAKSIDLICGPISMTSEVVEHTFPASDGRPLSDHRAYLVDFGRIDLP